MILDIKYAGKKLYLSQRSSPTMSSPSGLQFLVDMGTEGRLLDRTEEVAKKIANENPKDFKSNVSVTAQIGGEKDPMKFYIQVCWSFCYNGNFKSNICPSVASATLLPDFQNISATLYQSSLDDHTQT